MRAAAQHCPGRRGGRSGGSPGDQVADRARLRGAWSGDAAESFHASMESVEEAIEELARGLDGTKDVLVDAANAAVDAFNLLVELILEFLIWFLTEVIIAAVAAALSAGHLAGRDRGPGVRPARHHHRPDVQDRVAGSRRSSPQAGHQAAGRSPSCSPPLPPGGDGAAAEGEGAPGAWNKSGWTAEEAGQFQIENEFKTFSFPASSPSTSDVPGSTSTASSGRCWTRGRGWTTSPTGPRTGAELPARRDVP